MQQFKWFGQAFIVYIVIDVAYQIAIGISLLTHFLQDSPLKATYREPDGTGMLLMLIFFIVIAFSNLKLAIQPGIQARKIRLALVNGSILGAGAYGTLGLAQGWSLLGFPLPLVLTITLEGIIFCTCTSGLVTWWNLRSST